MNRVCNFIRMLSDNAKLNYSRFLYKKMMEDECFVRFMTSEEGFDLQIGKNAAVDDRFLFLYLCSEMKNTLSPEQYEVLAPIIYYLRQVSFTLQPTEKAENGVVVHPDTSRWNLNGDDGIKVFLSAWNIVPENYRDWIKDTFASIPERLAGLKGDGTIGPVAA